MINEANALIIALKNIANIFGLDYVKKHINCPVSRSMSGDIMIVSFLFEDRTQRKDLVPDYLGWCVFGTVEVNMRTASGRVVDYILPDGTRMNGAPV
jgi:hypothetical protein